MSWLGGSISSLTGQLSNLTKDILTEGTEEISDPTTELRLAKEKVHQLDAICTHQRSENERLKAINKELEEKAESSELQINSISREYRNLLEAKERDINSLRHQHQELLEEHARQASLSQHTPHDHSNTQHNNHFSSIDYGVGNDGGDAGGDWGDAEWGDFDSSIQLQRENNSLRSEVKGLQSQVKHWRSVAGQLGQSSGGQDVGQLSSSADVLELQHKIKDLESQLSRCRDDLQHQATSLHDLHREKVAALKVKHKSEVEELRQQLSELTEGSSSSVHSGSAGLPESDRGHRGDVQLKLKQALQDRDKAQASREHLQGVLAELQHEVESLQQQQEALHSDGGLQEKIAQLTKQLKESELSRTELSEQLQQTKAELASKSVQALECVKSEQDEVKAEVEGMLEALGDEGKHQATQEILSNLEKDNLMLKEENLKLEEQLVILQKSAATHANDKQRLHDKVATLRGRLRGLPGGEQDMTDEDDDDTLNTDLDSKSSHEKREECVDKELDSLRAQLAAQCEELSSLKAHTHTQEVHISQLEAKGHPDTHPHSVEALQSEISTLKSDKQELENALEELDSQHALALEQLISQRDKMAADLRLNSVELLQQKELVEELNKAVEQLKVELKDAENVGCEKQQANEKKFNELEQELATLRNKEVEGRNEITELTEKLQKGGIVINDLHMDKQELEGKVKKGREELDEKVLKLKELREENDRLETEKKLLEENQREITKELEKWQKISENNEIEEAEKEAKMVGELKQEIEKMVNQLKEEKLQSANLIETQSKLESDLESYEVQIETLTNEKVTLETKLKTDEERMQEISAKLAHEETKLVETLKQYEELQAEFDKTTQANIALQESHESQKKYFDSYVQDLSRGRELEAESLQAEHEKLLNLQRESSGEIDTLKARLQEKTMAAQSLTENLASFTQEMTSVKGEISRLEQVCEAKDAQISELKVKVNRFGNDLEDIESSVAVAEEKHSLELSGKQEQLAQLQERNRGLEKSLSQTQGELRSLSRSQSLADAAIQEEGGQADSQGNDQDTGEIDTLKETISQMEVQQALSQEALQRLHQDLASAQQTVQCHEFGIAGLNEKAEEHRRELEKAEAEVERQKNDIAVLRQSSLDKDSTLQQIHARLSYLLTILSPQQLEKLQQFNENPPGIIVPALEYKDVKAIEYVQDKSSVISSEQNGVDIQEIVDSSDSPHQEILHHKKSEHFEKETEELRERLKEKDVIVAELQKSNSSLLGLLEGKSAHSEDVQGAQSQVSTHRLEAELRSLHAEREQMVAVVSEKSRENSSLKAEVHRLMEVVSAGQAAMEKLQDDNRELEQQQAKGPVGRVAESEEDDMRREALGNMARLVRDREVEIEARDQKIATLMAVLQDASSESQAAAHLAPLLRDKETLTQQLADLGQEREQLVTCLTQKHSEVVAYYGETQRLAGLLTAAQAEAEQYRAEYNSMCPAFEDKSKALVAAQADVMEVRQKLKDLEVRHGELIHRSNSSDVKSGESPDQQALQGEVEQLRAAEAELRQAVTQREDKISALTHRIASLEEAYATRELETNHLRKQVDSSKFQMTGLMSELADLKQEKEKSQTKASQMDTETHSLRDSVNQLTLTLRDKEAEVTALRDQVMTLNSILQEQQGDTGQVTQLMRENEAVLASSRQLAQERDQQAMIAEQRQQDILALRAEIQSMKDKEFKLLRELERLRAHLIQMEEGYTGEAIEAEEREKDLRNRLAVAEEQLVASTSHVEQASHETSRQIESLEQQLQQVSSQRDAAYMQVASIQDQCQQYAKSLGNLQLVLEHFQKEKDSAIAAETQHYQEETHRLKTKVIEMQAELEVTRGDLTEALDGLEAASRLSEELDRKEDALRALKEEVQLRESALSAAEMEIQKLASSKEAKVDKQLMHNMVMTWLTSPDNKRMEIVHLIGNVLSFSQDDFKRIQAAQAGVAGGLLSSIFRRPASEAPQPDKSFSEMFVKFLERESSPPPTPVRLPAEAMAEEARTRHKQPGFNPFMAPRHVTHDANHQNTNSSANHFSFTSSSSHLLNDSPVPNSPLFAPLTTTPKSGESAILKDVLGKS